MKKLTRDDLLSLERYAVERRAFRENVLAHKKNRVVHITENASLYFEDRLSVQYQIQEMLRVERIFEPDAIEEELSAYNPLIPDGQNWKATFMLEYEDPALRRVQLTKLAGIEDKVWVQVQGFDKVWAIADEDLERSTQDKTSAVHFLRFELTRPMVDAVKSGRALGVGIDHQNYQYSIASIANPVRESLANDLI